MDQRASYDPRAIEERCQEAWKREHTFRTPPSTPGRKNTFVYACTPFTTGNAHIGHVRSYTIADVCARRARADGDAVLWAMGFDAFGLPNEMAAIKESISPREWVRTSRERMTEQFTRLGLSVDWSREFDTSDPDYYRWTQWLFLRFLERGLVYRSNGIENWCEHCKSVLASLQLTKDGCCWRCHKPVGLACIPQWYLRILPYASELKTGLDKLSGWDDPVLAAQRAMLARSDGGELDIALPEGRSLTVFTPYPHAVSSASFVMVSPNHPDLELLIPRNSASRILNLQRRRGLRREERSLHRFPAIGTGVSLRIPGIDRELPAVVTSAVDSRFGGGAAFGVPTIDEADAAIAAQLGLEVCRAAGQGIGPAVRPAHRYQLRDNSISRQRSWGAPIPIVHCSTCGLVPVPDADLPVRLPDDLLPTGQGNALENHPTFGCCPCPRCFQPARRDTDTLDVHFDSIWMLVPFCVPTADRAKHMFTHPELRRWLPVQQVVCGADQVGWWINDRLCFRALSDSGYFPDLENAEPVKNILMHEMVLANGRKMSKSIGNVAEPDAIIHRYGSDALRLAVLHVNPRKSFNWNEEALRTNYRFLADLWEYVDEYCLRDPLDPVCGDTDRDAIKLHKLTRWCTAAARKIDRSYEKKDFHLVLRDLKTLFSKLQLFSTQKRLVHAFRSDDAAAAHATIKTILDFLEPLAPHISHALCEKLALSPRRQPTDSWSAVPAAASGK